MGSISGVCVIPLGTGFICMQNCWVGHMHLVVKQQQHSFVCVGYVLGGFRGCDRCLLCAAWNKTRCVAIPGGLQTILQVSQEGIAALTGVL